MPKRKTYDLRPIYFVYILFDESYVPRYIGKGKNKRDISHELNVKKTKNWRKKNFIIATMRAIGEIPKIKITGLTEQQALLMETNLIIAIGRQDLEIGPLTNLTDGGEGTTSEDAKRREAKKTAKERSDIAKAREANKTPEERTAIAKKRENNISAAKKRERALKAWDGMTAQERSEFAIRREANITPEVKSARASKGGKALWDRLTPEERSEKARHISAGRYR